MKHYVIGEAATRQRTFEADDVLGFARLTSGAGRPPTTVPEGLIGGMFSDLLGTALPGRGTNWLKQKLRFVRAAKVGERLTARVEIIRIREDKDLLNLKTSCVGDDGSTVCVGEALVLAKEMDHS